MTARYYRLLARYVSAYVQSWLYELTVVVVLFATALLGLVIGMVGR